MSDIERKRAWVASLYPGPKWKKKVAKMPEGQVIAIYMREHGKPPKPKAAPKPKPKESSDDIPF